MKIKRNDLCTCGSNKKYKKCCLPIKDAKVAAQLREIEKFFMEIDPDFEDECNKILDLASKGDLIGAKRAIEPFCEQYANNYAYNFTEGVICCSENNYIEAIEYFNRATEIFPYCSEAFFNLAVAYLNNYDVICAVKAFEKVIEIDDRSSEALDAKRHLKGLSDMILKDSGLTFSEYAKLGDVYDLAFYYLEKKDFDSAIKYFNQVIESYPKHVQSHGNIGLAYGFKGENKLAIEHFNKALAIDPDYEPAQINLKAVSKLAEDQKLDKYDLYHTDYYREGIGSDFYNG